MDKFWSRVAKGEPNECWEWLGGRAGGYGWARFEGKTWRSHRLAYRLEVGPIPEGMCICHHCDNPSCVNPAHLWVGTIADNNRDMTRKGRQVPSYLPGELNGRSILTKNDVLEARRRHARGETAASLAKECGVSATTMQYAINGTTWSHI